MCELFGLSSNPPLALRETPLAEFRRHGGETADNPDGWGIAWRSPACPARFCLEKAPLPGAQSDRFAGLIETLASDLVIAHVRRARHPPVNTLANTHPFLRACCGRYWTFAHNGLVPEIVALETANHARVCHPEGETDSEFAFCHLLSHVTRQFDTRPADADRLAMLGEIGERIASHGKFNFLLADGEHLIAYGHDRLHYLESAQGSQRAVLIATEPLDARSGWTAFAAGELRIYHAGRRVVRILTHPPAPNIDLETSST